MLPSDQPLGSQIPVIFDPRGNKAKGRLDKMNRNGKKLLTLGMVLLVMFVIWTFQTYLVGAGASSLREAIKLFWTFRVPWGWTYTAGTVADWVAQFSFGFYSLMLTFLLLELIVMVLYKPRTWCTFCQMGTMTQGICKLKNNEKK